MDVYMNNKKIQLVNATRVQTRTLREVGYEKPSAYVGDPATQVETFDLGTTVGSPAAVLESIVEGNVEKIFDT